MRAIKTACIDFDGVLATYQRPQDGSWDAPPGEPIRLGIEILHILFLERYRIVVHSSRDADEIRRWLLDYGYSHLVDEVSNKKVPAHVYLDDRAVRFNPEMPIGELWDRLIEEPWWNQLPTQEDGGGRVEET